MVSSICQHDLVGPLSVDVVNLVDLEPSGSNARFLRGIVDGAEKEVGDWARVAGSVPADGNAVSLAGSNGVNARRDGAASDVAGHIVASDVCHGAVARWHPQADLVSRRHIVDPHLVEVLVG